MTIRRPWLGIAAAILFAAAPSLAQKAGHDDHDDHDRDRDRHHHPEPVTITVAGPTIAPPPPQAEVVVTKAGYEWIGGRWDWKDGKWSWLKGHFEAVRAGKHWHPGRWEQHGATWAYVDGEWGAGDAPVIPGPPPPPGPPGPPPPPEEHHRDWKLDRPVVSSYWPPKGKVGAHVVIRGRNFPDDVQVMWGATQVAAAHVKPDEIRFDVPPGAHTDVILLHRSHGRDLPVGNFEVVASDDWEAEQRRADDERRKRAQAEWDEQSRALAKDRAAREAAWQKADAEREANREQRRHDREEELRKKWEAAFLADPDTQAELTLHAQRVAALERAKEIAQLKNDAKLGVRIDIATSKETDRHEQRMAALHAGFATKGGAP